MGYDAAFLSTADDLALIRMARAEGRVILTRSRKLSMRRGTQTILIRSQALDEQIAQVKAQAGPPPEPRTPRCAICNVPLIPLSHEAAQGRVPPYVWRTEKDFSACPDCHRVYWAGSHWQAIRERTGSPHNHPNNRAAG